MASNDALAHRERGKPISVVTDGLRTALRIMARVQSGNKNEITAPDLQEGHDVDVFLIPRPVEPPPRRSVAEFLVSRPPGPLSAPTWDEIQTRIVIEGMKQRDLQRQQPQ